MNPESVVGPGVMFAADAAMVAWAAWLATCAAGLPRRGLVESSLGWLLLGLAWIAGSGVVLGSCGWLGPTGFFGIHAAALAGLLALRRSVRTDFDAWRDWGRAWVRLLGSRMPEGWIAGGIIAGGLVLAVLAAQVEPIIYDALTYRLSRIGAWLQDGWIRHYATDDPRINYMPLAPDVVIAWLVGATREGFYLAPLSQLAGGILLLGSTYGLARMLGLSRLTAFGAVILVLGMANVAVQFTTVQSDLFTAGVFAAAYLLWHRAWARGEGSWVAGVGVALAFGSKGTLFYLAPGAAVWVGWLVWRQRGQCRSLGSTTLGFVAAGVVLVVPGYWRNHATYGSLFGPHEAVVLHHGEFPSAAHFPEKTILNLGTSAAQALEPNAQPLWLQESARAAGEWLAGKFPAEPDPYVFIGQSRRAQLESVMRLPEPDADVVTCGLLAIALFAGGVIASIFLQRTPAATQVLVWSAGVAAYLATQHGLVQWHRWSFRFLVLVAPWMGVVGAWAVSRLPGKFRVAAWTALVVSSLQVFAVVQMQTSQAVWQALMNPTRSGSYFYYSNWRAWAQRLDQPAAPLRLAFPINQPLASFYRLNPPRVAIIERLSDLDAPTAEAAVTSRSGWLLVPLEHFMGREGRVMGRVGLFNLAAYRALAPGEKPEALLYGSRLIPVDKILRHELVVRTWTDVPVRLELTNPGRSAWRFQLRTPTAERIATVPAGGRLVIEAPVPADVIALITVDFSPPDAGAASERAPGVRLIP